MDKLNNETRKKMIICPVCYGFGVVKDHTGDTESCKTCVGKGKLYKISTVTYEVIGY